MPIITYEVLQEKGKNKDNDEEVVIDVEDEFQGDGEDDCEN